MTSDTVNDHELNDLIDARYMGLSCPPSSPQAHVLVDSITQIITKVETRKRKRKKDTEADFRSAVGLMVGDLLIGVETKDAGWSYHQLSRSAFSDRPIGYKMFKSIITMMETSGLLDVSLGRNAVGPQFDGSDNPAYYPSLASRFRPTVVMTSLVVAAGIGDEGVRRHFQQQLPKTTIEVRAKKITLNGKKLNGKKLRFTHTDKSKAMEVEMKELNSFLSSFSLEGAGFSGYRRLFNNGDIDGFDFQWGGRVHAVGDDNYQSIKKEKRKYIKIEGKEVIEIDINASYLSILHGINGYTLPDKDDIYDISGIDRTIVKAWITSTIGHFSFHSKWLPQPLAEIRAAGIDKPKSMTMTSIQPIILEHFPMLADWPLQKITWADLMFIESEVIIGTMVELMRSFGVPCFSIHDSIIVRRIDQIIALDTLRNQFVNRVGIEPRLKVK